MHTLESLEPSVTMTTQDQFKTFDPGLISLMTKMSREAAIDTAMMLSASEEKARQAFWDKIKAEVDKLERPKPQVLAVRYKESEIRKLSRPAPKFLGEMLDHVNAGNHILLVGPAGCGKSTAAEILAEALSRKFAGLSFSKGASETWLMGRQLPTGFRPSQFCEIYEQGGVFMADEIDAADPNLLINLNNALANGWFYNPIEGRIIHKHPNFVCVAGANTYGKGADSVYTGRDRLDGATLDRFWTINVGYDRNLELELSQDRALCKIFWSARDTLEKLGAQECLSTRKLVQASRLKQSCGWRHQKIFHSITSSWAQELVESCGLNKIKEEEEEEAPSRDAKPAQGAQDDSGDQEAAKVMEELEKARTENQELKTKRKAFGNRG